MLAVALEKEHGHLGRTRRFSLDACDGTSWRSAVDTVHGDVSITAFITLVAGSSFTHFDRFLKVPRMLLDVNSDQV